MLSEGISELMRSLSVDIAVLVRADATTGKTQDLSGRGGREPRPGRYEPSLESGPDNNAGGSLLAGLLASSFRLDHNHPDDADTASTAAGEDAAPR